MKTVHCYHCGKQVKLEYKISFREECLHCKADLHICRNCRFYDKLAYNECKESSAEKIQDKEKNNYCEYFDPSSENQGKPQLLEREKLLQSAEALFKKDFQSGDTKNDKL